MENIHCVDCYNVKRQPTLPSSDSHHFVHAPPTPPSYLADPVPSAPRRETRRNLCWSGRLPTHFFHFARSRAHIYVGSVACMAEDVYSTARRLVSLPTQTFRYEKINLMCRKQEILLTHNGMLPSADPNPSPCSILIEFTSLRTLIFCRKLVDGWKSVCPASSLNSPTVSRIEAGH